MTSPASDCEELARRYDDLRRRHALELRLADTISAGGGIVGLVRAAEEVSGRCVWLLDRQGRCVARALGRHSELTVPPLSVLLEEAGPVDVGRLDPVVLGPRPARDLVRRHILTPVCSSGVLFAWLVTAEIPGRFTAFDQVTATRAARYLAAEYTTQRRIARVSWNARSALARQMVRGSACADDLRASADYLGVDVDSDRAIVFLTDADDGPLRDDETTAEALSRALGVEVLGARGTQGTILLVEADEELRPVVMVNRVKRAVAAVLRKNGENATIAGISAVVAPDSLNRAYREAREVVVCAGRFVGPETRVIAVDDLGPARLFVANSDTEAVRRYMRDVLGPLLDESAGHGDLLRTLQCFFDTGRSVRESSARLGIHENTVRLRLGKVHDLTGLDVAAGANDQLSVQTALLVLRLVGHPAIPAFGDHHELEQQESA